MCFPERVKLDIEAEIDGFERTIFSRLLPCFDSIEDEAKIKADAYLQRASKNFDPDFHDEGSFYDEALSEELYHIQIEEMMKHEFLNSSVIWLCHLYERQAKRTFSVHNKEQLSFLFGSDYNLDKCSDWRIISEFRIVANAIKHGENSDAAKRVRKLHPNLLNDTPFLLDSIVKINKQDIERYIESLRSFWKKALKNRVVLSEYEDDEDSTQLLPPKEYII